MEILTIFMMLMAILAGIIGMGSMTHLMRDLRSPEAIWTYRCLLISNLLLVVGLGCRYLEYHLAERFTGQPFFMIQLVLLDFLIPLKLTFLYSLARTGENLTRSSHKTAMLEVAAEKEPGLGATHLLKLYGITKREEEVIRLICEGKSNKEIADRLFISVDTVKDHNHNIFRKTGVSNRVQLVNLFR